MVRNQCWNMVNCAPGNKLQWNLNRNAYIFIQENALENVVWEISAILSWPQCVLIKTWNLIPLYDNLPTAHVGPVHPTAQIHVYFLCASVHIPPFTQGLLEHSSKPETLRWRHNESDGVSNHQHHDCLLNRLSRCRSKKTPKLRVTDFVRGIHRWPVNSPHKGPVTRKMFPFDDVIMMIFQTTHSLSGSVTLHRVVAWKPIEIVIPDEIHKENSIGNTEA